MRLPAVLLPHTITLRRYLGTGPTATSTPTRSRSGARSSRTGAESSAPRPVRK